MELKVNQVAAVEKDRGWMTRRLAPLALAIAFGVLAGGVSAADHRTPRAGHLPAPPVKSHEPSDTGGDSAARTLRLFRLLHRDPSDAFALVQPLLSAAGSITVSPRLKVITVQDDEAHIAQIAEAIRQFDVAPKSYRIQVSFFRATGGADDGKPAPAPAQLRGYGKRMADLLKYSNYSQIDDIVVTGDEGTPLSARMGAEYAVDFFIEGDPHGGGDVRLRNFRVSRVKKDERGVEQLTHVFGTSINLQLEKPFILGATRDEQSRTALLIVLNAKAAPASP